MTTNAMDAPAVRRLQRPREGRVVAGVSLGLGRYFDVDPVIFRIVFAVLAVFGGAGLVLYGVGWLLMPEEGSPASHLDDFLARHRRPGRRGWLAVALVVVGLIWVSSALVRSHPGGIVGAAVLLGAGVLIAREHNRSRDAQMSDAQMTDSQMTAASPAYAAETVVAPYAVRRPRPRSPLVMLTLSATLVAVGIVTALGISGVVHPQPADVVAVALGVVAVGLLVGAVWGRSWLLIPLGLLLVLTLGVARAIPPDVPWTSGNRTWTPTATDVHNRYALGVGDARLDLTRLDLTGGRSIAVRLGAGRLVVVVPAGTTVDVHARASAGHLQLAGSERNGTGLDETTVLQPVSVPPTGRVSLDLRIGFGDVEVDRAA